MTWLQRMLHVLAGGASIPPPEEPESAEALEARRKELEQTLNEADRDLRERSDALYGLQQRYSSEHFDLQESMRNLKIERLRNAGIQAAHDIVVQRYNALRERIADLQARLRCYEDVEDDDTDDCKQGSRLD